MGVLHGAHTGWMSPTLITTKTNTIEIAVYSSQTKGTNLLGLFLNIIVLVTKTGQNSELHNTITPRVTQKLTGYWWLLTATKKHTPRKIQLGFRLQKYTTKILQKHSTYGTQYPQIYTTKQTYITNTQVIPTSIHSIEFLSSE